MCSHLLIHKKNGRDYADALGAEIEGAAAGDEEPRELVAPSERHWMLKAVADRRVLAPASFGFAHVAAPGKPAKKGLLINARSETVHKLPTFRDAFVRRRCLLPADGFYEWTGEKGARCPVRFERAGGGLLLVCGLYQDEIDPVTGAVRTVFTVLTTPANDVVGRVHDRMPALLVPDGGGAVDAWLGAHKFDAAALLGLLRPAPSELLSAEEVRPEPPREAPIKLPRKPAKAAESRRPPPTQLKLF